MKGITINIGIDFGISYSKVCFQDSITRKKDYIKFYTKNPKYKHSKLYFDYHKRIMYYIKPKEDNSIETVRYFKYSMIDRSLRQQTSINSKSDYDILCCIFFVACLIKNSKEYIKKELKKHGEFKYNWNITMGVPVENYSDKHKELYDRILQIAIILSDNIDNYSIASEYLNEYYQKHINIKLPGYAVSPNNTISELYAECISFLNDINVPEGLYAIIDIGGATVDMAVIYKKINKENPSKNRFGIVSKSTQPLGIEIIINRIAIEDRSFSNVRKLLFCNSFQAELPNYNIKEEEKLRKKMKESFARLVIEAKEKGDIREILKSQNGVIKVIICGGGVNYKWYKSCISSVKGQIRPTLDNIGYKMDFESVDTLKRSYKIDDHRLIIANSLAQPIKTIPQPEGFPWHFQERKQGLVIINKYDRYYDEQIKQKEKYGDTV